MPLRARPCRGVRLTTPGGIIGLQLDCPVPTDRRMRACRAPAREIL